MAFQVQKQQSYPVSPLGSPGLNPENARSNFIDLSQKRRSHSMDKESEGKPFISIDKSSQPKKKFFLDSDSDEENLDLKSQIISKVKTLSQFQCYNVCQELHITPPTNSLLCQFIDAINPSNLQLLTAISILINKQNQIKAQPLNCTKPGISENTLLDVRYQLLDNSENIIEKTVVGLANFDISFDLVPFPPNIHVILQSFISDSTKQGLCFPQTLRIFINNVQVKAQGFYPFTLFDLTKYCTTSTCNVRITCGIERQAFTIEALPVGYYDYKQIVQMIQNGQVFPESIDSDQVCLFDPITGKLMKNPCRGINCKHQNCFEMLSFLKLANTNQKWFCPICKQPLHVNELMYSHKTKDLLREAMNQTTSSLSLPQFGIQQPVQNQTQTQQMPQNPFFQGRMDEENIFDVTLPDDWDF